MSRVTFFRKILRSEKNVVYLQSNSGLGHFKQPLRRHLAMKRQRSSSADNGLTGLSAEAKSLKNLSGLCAALFYLTFLVSQLLSNTLALSTRYHLPW